MQTGPAAFPGFDPSGDFLSEFQLQDYRYELSPGVGPRPLTLTALFGASSGKQLRGLARLEGDRLTIVLGPAGEQGPAAWPAADDHSYDRMIVLQRKPGTSPKTNTRAAESLRERLGAEKRRLSDERARLRDELNRIQPELEVAKLSIDVLKERYRTFSNRLSDAESVVANKAGNENDSANRWAASLRSSVRGLAAEIEQALAELAGRQGRAEELEWQIGVLDRRWEAIASREPLDRAQGAEPGDLIRVEVLEALPGRPITGLRLVRPDGTISLEFYGDVQVAGLTREQIKVRVVERLRQFLSDDVLGLMEINPETLEVYVIAPADTDRIFVDDQAGQEMEAIEKAGPASSRLDDLQWRIENIRNGLIRAGILEPSADEDATADPAAPASPESPGGPPATPGTAPPDAPTSPAAPAGGPDPAKAPAGARSPSNPSPAPANPSTPAPTPPPSRSSGTVRGR